MRSPFIDFNESSIPQTFSKQTISALFAFPKLKPSGDNPGDKDNGMHRLETFFLQLHAWRVRQGARDRLRYVLRKARGHGVVEEQEEPPRDAHAPDEPATGIHARPLRLVGSSVGFLVMMRFLLGIVVIVGQVLGWRRRRLFPLNEGHFRNLMLNRRKKDEGTFVKISGRVT